MVRRHASKDDPSAVMKAYLSWFPFFHSLFLTEAALLLPNINVEVCLFAPVLREIAGGPEKTSFRELNHLIKIL